MKTVRLGCFNLPAYAAEKPVGFRDDGKLIFAFDLLEGRVPPFYGLSFGPAEYKTNLALARIKLEPDFYVGVIGSNGLYSKAEVIRHIELQTALGRELVDIEIKYAEYFTHQLLGDIPAPPLRRARRHRRHRKTGIPQEWKWVPKKQQKLFKSRVLFCENTTDPVTTPAAEYRIAHVHPVFTARGFHVTTLKGVNDIRANFLPHAQDPLVVYVGGVGHGDYTLYSGYDQPNPILQVSDYGSDEVKNKVMHFLSCRTGRTLGPDTVIQGAKAYVGYDDDFFIDWANADLFWQCDSQFDISMAGGETVEQAIADTNTGYDSAISSFPGTITAAYLLSNKGLLRSPVSDPVWGDKTITINPLLFTYITLADFFNR